MDSEEKWKIEVSGLLGEIKANQLSMQRALNDHIASEGARIEDLEHTVNGNGSKGIAEDVRNLKGKYALIAGIIIFIASVAANALISKYIGSAPADVSISLPK